MIVSRSRGIRQPGRRAAAMRVEAGAHALAADTSTLKRIRENGEIRLGYVNGAAPFSFAGEDGKAPQGYSVDLCRRIAEGVRGQLELKELRTRWVPLTVQDRLAAVREGKVDIECSTTTWTLSRQRDVDFSLIVFVDGAMTPSLHRHPRASGIVGPRVVLSEMHHDDARVRWRPLRPR